MTDLPHFSPVLPDPVSPNSVSPNPVLADREAIAPTTLAAQLAQRDRQFKTLAAHLPGAIFEFVSHEGVWRVNYISDFIEQLAGISAAAMMEDISRFIELLHPEDLPAYFASVEAAIVSGQPWVYEGRLIRPQGEIVWWQGQSTPFCNESGEVIFCGVLLDITTQKTAALALQTLNAELATRVAQQGQQLLAKEVQYQQIFEAVSDGLMLLDLEAQRLVEVNPAACQMHGYEREEFLNLSPEQFVHPDSWPVFTESMQKIVLGESFFVEAKDLHRDGRTLEIEVRASPFYYEGNIYALSLIRDISDRKRMEGALRDREARLQNIYNSVPGVIFQYCTHLDTGEESFSYLSPRAIDLYGIPAEAILANSQLAWSAVHPEDFDRLRQGVKTALQNHQPWQDEFRLVQPSGRIVWVRGQTEPAGTTAGMSINNGVMLDISQQKEAEQELQKTQVFLNSIVENMPSSVFVKDAQDLRYLIWNRAAEQMTGLTSNVVLGKTDVEIFGAELAQKFQAADRRTLRQKATLEIAEEVLDTASQGQRLVRTTKLPLFDSIGVPQYLLGISQDITQRKAAEQALLASSQQLREQAEREQLLNRLTHTIRNSLDLDVILTVAVREIRNFLHIDRCAFAWYRHGATMDEWEVVVESRRSDLESWCGSYSASTLGDITARLLRLDYFQMDDRAICDDPLYVQQSQEAGVQASLFMPVAAKPEQVGAIYCSHHANPRPWSAQEVDLLQAIAEQVGIALRQADLYQEAQARSRELEAALDELQRTQLQMIQSEKMSGLGEMVAGVAHEINNPVNFIHGNLDHLQQYAQSLLNLVDLYQKHYPEPVEAIVDEMEEIDLEFLKEDLIKLLASMRVGTNRIREIVLSLRNFSRLDEAEVKDVDLHEGLDSSLTILQNRLKAKPEHPEIQVYREYGALPKVECFAGQLNQVFMNILSNAIDALEERDSRRSREAIAADPSYIRLRTYSTAQRTVGVEISDNGPGIPPEIQHRLFDPFFTTKKVGKGTGLGLSISYQIITEMHGGQLVCHSVLGQGTTFTLEIPIHQTAVGEPRLRAAT